MTYGHEICHLNHPEMVPHHRKWPEIDTTGGSSRRALHNKTTSGNCEATEAAVCLSRQAVIYSPCNSKWSWIKEWERLLVTRCVSVFVCASMRYSNISVTLVTNPIYRGLDPLFSFFVSKLNSCYRRVSGTETQRRLNIEYSLFSSKYFTAFNGLNVILLGM